MDMSYDKESDKIDQISKIDEEIVTEYIEVLKMGKLSSQKNIDNIEKESDERNRMDMSDDKDSDERDQLDKNDEERATNDIEVLKPVTCGFCRKIQTIIINNPMKEIG